MGKVLPGRGVFVTKYTAVDDGTAHVPCILVMNIIGELRELLLLGGSIKSGDFCHIPREIMAKVGSWEHAVGRTGRIGYEKVAGRQKVVVPPVSEFVIDGWCQMGAGLEKHQVLVEPTEGVSLPHGIVVADS